MRSRVWPMGCLLLAGFLPGCKITPSPTNPSAPPPSVRAAVGAPASPSGPAAPALPTVPPPPAPTGPATGVPYVTFPQLPPAPAPTDDDLRAALDERLTRIRGALAADGRRGLLLSRPENYAWLTGGLDNTVAGRPVGALVILPDRVLIAGPSDLLDALRAPLRGLGWAGVRYRWDVAGDPAALVAAVRAQAGTGVLAADTHLPGTEYAADTVVGWRLHLGRVDRPRLTWLGQIAADTVAQLLGAAQATDTERDLERKLAAALRERDVDPRDVRVTALDRLEADGLTHGGDTKLESGAAVRVTAARWGLQVTLGRTLTPSPRAEATDAYATARQVMAGLLGAVQPGATLRDVYVAGVRAAAAAGHADLFRLQSPGGVGAFEPFVRPFGETAVETLDGVQAATLQVRLPRAYLAETVLVRPDEIDQLTVTASWPSPPMVIHNRLVPVPTLRGAEVAVAEAEQSRAAAQAALRGREFVQNLLGATIADALASAPKLPPPAAPATAPTPAAPAAAEEERPAPPAGAAPKAPAPPAGAKATPAPAPKAPLAPAPKGELSNTPKG